MRKLQFILVCMFPIMLSGMDQKWDDFWQNGLHYYYSQEYQKASQEFDNAINLMSKEDIEKFPFVIISRIQNDYTTQNYSRVISDSEKILGSKYLSEYERLICGSIRAFAFHQMENEEFAVREYDKYIANSPLMPKLDFFEDKIILRNMPDCHCFKKWAKNWLLSSYFQDEDAIHEFDNMWIFNVKQEERSPAQKQACCNTCSRLALSAGIVCNSLPLPPVFGGPFSTAACRGGCLYIVELIRQSCDQCCMNGYGLCWKIFEKWKDEFKAKHPECPHPSKL